MQDQPELTFLCLGGLCVRDMIAPALPLLTALCELELHNAADLSPYDYGLGNLTTMQQLTRLKLEGVGCRRHISLCLKSTSQVNGRGFLVHG